MASLKQSWKDFWRYRYLLQNLITRDFKLKYRRSVLGVAWSVLNPLLMCLVMYAIFTSIFAGMRGQNIDNFAVFLLVGQLLFNFFRESTTLAMESVLKNSPLLRKVYIPKYIFPLEKVCFGLVNCLFSFVALVLVMLITRTPLHLSFILCVYPLATLFFFCLGIGLFLSATYVFFRDVMHMWEVFCTALTYASAIFYDPEQMTGIVYHLIHLNPLYWYITAFRSCVLWGQGLTGLMVLVCGGCAVFSMAVGIFVFKRNQDRFVLYM